VGCALGVCSRESPTPAAGTDGQGATTVALPIGVFAKEAVRFLCRVSDLIPSVILYGYLFGIISSIIHIQLKFSVIDVDGGSQR
jgi:hypothetical protein